MALLRRLEKRVLVPLPNAQAREAMLRRHLAGRTHCSKCNQVWQKRMLASLTSTFRCGTRESLCLPTAEYKIYVSPGAAAECPRARGHAAPASDRAHTLQQHHQQVRRKKEFLPTMDSSQHACLPMFIQVLVPLPKHAREAMLRRHLAGRTHCSKCSVWRQRFLSVRVLLPF